MYYSNYINYVIKIILFTPLLFRRKEIYVMKYIKQGSACDRTFNTIFTLNPDVINVAICNSIIKIYVI